MRRFETRGPVNQQKHYVVSRVEETADFINRIKEGRYVVIFSPCHRHYLASIVPEFKGVNQG